MNIKVHVKMVEIDAHVTELKIESHVTVIKIAVAVMDGHGSKMDITLSICQ